ncbi:universal stress protein [Pseudomarimonas salicorniae]|uniref:Universal stress protein n=1 Tax=Pseudomarimonas salicorniae TaxID=2933270 RepID=A0ABT0GG59_9GAMM|nr:universal stress protein [Lysobacter sp. CAU 1642]MCK7593037.1 universal stress protein [Lysobacter sp. CAU 1642]
MKLLVALDLSGSSAQVLEVAKGMARATAASLWLLHVAEPEPDFVGYEAGPQVVRDQVAEAHRRDHGQIQAHARALRDEGMEVTALQIQGSIAQAILDEAERLAVDLIIMGTHGHGAVFDLIVGSTSQAVLRSSALPVLLVPVRAR